MIKRFFTILFAAIGFVSNAQIYKEVKIGDQIWMAENLNVDKFRNGDPILEAKTAEEWIQAGRNKQPAWCYYENDPSNGIKHGKLYNWYALIDRRGLAPIGWHLPNDNECDILVDFLGGEDLIGGKIKSQFGWNDKNHITNESGFSATPGGFRNFDGNFEAIGSGAYWWTHSKFYSQRILFDFLGYGGGYEDMELEHMNEGVSIRCIKK